MPASGPAKSARRSTPRPQQQKRLRLPARALPSGPQPRVDSPSLVASQETSLVDVIDNLLNRGVVLNADLILALADVDLVYLRLSALVCAADRVLDGSR